MVFPKSLKSRNSGSEYTPHRPHPWRLFFGVHFGGPLKQPQKAGFPVKQGNQSVIAASFLFKTMIFSENSTIHLTCKQNNLSGQKNKWSNKVTRVDSRAPNLGVRLQLLIQSLGSSRDPCAAWDRLPGLPMFPRSGRELRRSWYQLF